MSLLATKSLSKSFGGLDAVRNVDLTLEPGRIRALIGPNGAGKTTLIQHLMGLQLPDEGVHGGLLHEAEEGGGAEHLDITGAVGERRVELGHDGRGRSGVAELRSHGAIVDRRLAEDERRWEGPGRAKPRETSKNASADVGERSFA